MKPLLEARDLRRSYHGRTVVAVDTLTLTSGGVLAVVGPSGAGKSTLFRLLALVEPPDAGTILFQGVRTSAGDTRALRRIAAVFQRPTLFGGTVLDNVLFGLRARGTARRDARTRALAALSWFGLDQLADTVVGRLSGGEAQRVALARALVLEPDVLLLDEPTASLDAHARRQFRADLDHAARRHARGVILITHDVTEALALANRIAVMQEGRIVQVGTPDDVVLRPGTRLIAELTGAELLLDGTVRSTEDQLVEVRVAEQTLWAMAHAAVPAPGTAVHVAYRPEDVLLAADDRALVSARNQLAVRVESVTPAGAFVRVRLHGPLTLVALITRRSADALRVYPGAPMVARLKAAALRVFPA